MFLLSQEATNGTLANKSDFPTLGEANKEAARPGGKGKSKKGTKLGLQEFLGKPGGGSSTYTDKMSDKEILLNLPTAPRGGPREEGPPGGLGGGFRDYGGDREGRGKFPLYSLNLKGFYGQHNCNCAQDPAFKGMTGPLVRNANLPVRTPLMIGAPRESSFPVATVGALEGHAGLAVAILNGEIVRHASHGHCLQLTS